MAGIGIGTVIARLPGMGYNVTPTGWYATFDPKRSPGAVRQLPVEAWSQDGLALVPDQEGGRLMPAHAVAGFGGLHRCSKEVTAVIPAAPGWRVRQVDGQDVGILDVIGWTLTTDGSGSDLVGLPVVATKSCKGAWVIDIEYDDNSTLLTPRDPDDDAKSD